MVLSGEPRKKSPVTTPGIDPGTVRLVAQRLNYYATLGPLDNGLAHVNLLSSDEVMELKQPPHFRDMISHYLYACL